jgi:hypothetical protein
MDCMNFAGSFSPKTVKRAEELTLALDDLKDVSELAGTLTFPDNDK